MCKFIYLAIEIGSIQYDGEKGLGVMVWFGRIGGLEDKCDDSEEQIVCFSHHNVLCTTETLDGVDV